MPKPETALQREACDDGLAVPSVNVSGMLVAIRPYHDLKTRAILLSLGIDLAKPRFSGGHALTARLRAATLVLGRLVSLGRDTARTATASLGPREGHEIESRHGT